MQVKRKEQGGIEPGEAWDYCFSCGNVHVLKKLSEQEAIDKE